MARSVPLLHPHTRPFVANIVTLATPHVQLPYAFDETVHEFYNLLLSNNNDETLLVSISGGMRDEMIPPRLCQVPSSSKSLSVRDGALIMH